MKKKILSMLLAVVMLVSVLPMSAISAYATTYSSDVKIKELNTGDIIKRGVKILPYTGYCWVDGKNYYSTTGTNGWTAPTCVSLTVTRGTGITANTNIKVTTTNACNSNTQGTLKTAATCTAAAVYNYKCSICGTNTATKSVGSAQGHDYTNYRDGGEATAATCTTAATHYKMCSRCTSKSGTYTYGSALGHTYTKQGPLVSKATCTAKAVYNKQCTRCTATSGTMEVGEALGHNFVDGICSKCSVSNVDFTAYNSALAEVDVLDEDAYTAESIAEYKEAVENAKVNKTTATITQTDIATAKILSAKTLLNKKRCSVAVYTVDDNSSTLVDTATVNYGDVYNASVSLADNQRVYKWTMRNNGKDSRLNTKDTFVSQVINGDTVLYCYVDNEPVNHDETSRVVFYDRSNRVISINYVSVGAIVSTAGVTAPEVAFYAFNGWEVVKGDPSNAPVSGVEFRATYAYKQSQANQVLIVGVGDVKVNGVHEYKAYYDEVLKLTGATSYAYGDNDGNVIEGISGDYIYAPNNQKTIYIVAGQSTKATTKLTGWVDDNNKITANAQYYLPSDCSLVEAGVKVAKTADALTTGSRFKAELIGETGEYSITLGYGSSKGTLYFASYLIYKDSEGKQHTIYSDAEAISFGA